MNARDKILNSIAESKPALSPLPGIIISSEDNHSSRVQKFKQMIETNGGSVIESEDLEIVQKDMERSTAGGECIHSLIPALGTENSLNTKTGNAISLASLDRVFLKSRLGVAENGAVWLAETDMTNRLLPFICQHLVIVLEAKDIVSNMHEAYKRIHGNQEDYHLFLAGPSKTADIEQSLVIGAHGARSLLVYLISGPVSEVVNDPDRDERLLDTTIPSGALL
jgi:L-lactate dehydrogenase complex protein LldG